MQFKPLTTSYVKVNAELQKNSQRNWKIYS